MLVRNTVSHDARVLREADVLHGLGLRVLVAGVVSTRERERRLRLGEVDVVRLDPAAGIRGVVPGRGRGVRKTENRGVGAAAAAAGGAGAGGPGGGPLARLKRLALTAAYYLQGIALVRRLRPALVHANDYNTMWIGIAAKLLCGSRLVYDCHELWADRNGRPEWRPWLIASEAMFVRAADVVITTSPGYAEAIARRYRVRPPVLVRNIPSRPPAAAAAAAASGGARNGGGAPLAVYVGGLMPARGLEQAIDALAQAPGARLRLIGPGSDGYLGRLRRRAEQAGVSERVEIEAPVAPQHVLEAIAGADLGLMLIQPACRSYELTLPNKLFEYAAAGLPILSSDLPVIGAVVRDEGIGAVVPPADAARIAEGLLALADPEVNRRRRERVRAFAQRETWERERATLERIYRSLLGPEGDGGARRG